MTSATYRLIAPLCPYGHSKRWNGKRWKCGECARLHMQRVRSGIPPRAPARVVERELALCRCGCGGRVTKMANQFIQGHARKGRGSATFFGKWLDQKLEQPMHVKCGLPGCDWEMDGPAKDCITAGREHREQEHEDIGPPMSEWERSKKHSAARKQANAKYAGTGGIPL